MWPKQAARARVTVQPVDFVEYLSAQNSIELSQGTAHAGLNNFPA
jgi:hypothetical protein